MPSTAGDRPANPDILIVEAWGQGFMVGSLILMIAITVANMKSGVLLHKAIVAELALAIGHGTFIFFHRSAYGWCLSVTAVGLNMSWSLHNLISWMKIRGFFTPWGTRLYLISLLVAQPYWILEIFANFTFFNYKQTMFLKTRPLEPLFRDPWWIFTTCFLLYTIRRGYGCSLTQLVRSSPRFGIMLLSMAVSIAFIIVDTCAVLGAYHLEFPTGIEPFWKLGFIFKCLSDTIILDDFKTTLDRLRRHLCPDLLQSEEVECRVPALDSPQVMSPAPDASLRRPVPVHKRYGIGVSHEHLAMV
ncbi:hypothetical protein CNMCM8980_007168 [Aspergillus fumigatiaffinis]|nr:hypothetical protein CNMCM8980_007168 [Aspergillus fumigatiaffinis]